MVSYDATTLSRGRVWLATLLLVTLAACSVDSSGLAGSGTAGHGGTPGGTGGSAAATGGTGNSTGGGSGGTPSTGTGGTAANQSGGATGGGASGTGGAGGQLGTGGVDAGTAGAGGDTGGAGGSAGAGGGSAGAGGVAGAGGRSGTGGWWSGTGGWWGGTGGTTTLPMCDSSIRDKSSCTFGSADCLKNCGVDDLATKPCSCVSGSWSCGTCTYPAGDYSCYELPVSGVPSCAPGTTNGDTACFGMCSLCSGYLDSTDTWKSGYCACLNDGPNNTSVYRCASSAEWPPQ